MYIREDCWLRDKCNHIDCKSSLCRRLYLTDKFYHNALLSDNEKIDKVLTIKDDSVDKPVFDSLYSIKNYIVEFVNEGNNIYMYSKITGNGKTSWAIKLVQEYIDRIWYRTSKDCPVLFINVPRYLLAIKDNITDKNDYVQHIKENVLDCDIVVWDDIGTKSATSFEHETLLSIIDTRNSKGKTNIYTSNLNGTELLNFVGERLYSRIYNNSFPYVFEFKAKDARRVA